MTAFLDIVQEVRDRILEIVLSTPCPNPASSDNISDRHEITSIDYRSWSRSSDILYKSFNRVDLSPLLLVNKQMHTETLAAIERLPVKHSYVADVVFLNETYLPTWLRLPQMSTDVDSIYASIRYIGTSETRYNAFMGGDGSPPRLYWLFYSLLECVLRAGVVGNPSASVTVKLLDLDIISPSVAEDATYPYQIDPMQARIAKRACPDHPEFMNPGRIVRAVQTGIGTLLGLYRDASELGKLLYSNLGIIRLRLDGKVRKEWNISEILGGLNTTQYNKATPDDQEAFVIWKEHVIRKRIERGLAVPITSSRFDE